MKGLLIKDFFCLRKQYLFFVITILTTFAIAVMFVCSYHYGNLHAGFAEMVQGGEMTAEDITALAQNIMLVCLLIPMALTGNVAEVFTDDKNASFQKLAASFPISIQARVASRFITGMFFTLIGFLSDASIVAVLSVLTDLIDFVLYIKCIIFFAALMVLYLSLLILFVYALGAEKMSIAGTMPFITIILGFLIVRFDAVKQFFLNAEMTAMPNLKGYIVDQALILAVIACCTLLISYVVCVLLAKKKRGVA